MIATDSSHSLSVLSSVEMHCVRIAALNVHKIITWGIVRSQWSIVDAFLDSHHLNQLFHVSMC